MMTGGKMIVTYKRKRPPPTVAYKLRRLPLRDELHQKNESSGPKLPQTSVEQKLEPTTINERECPIKGFEHTPEEKGHLSDSMKEGERNHFAVHVKASKSENKNQNIPNMMQLAAEPLAVLDTSPRLCLNEDGLSAKDEAPSLCTSAATKRKLGRSLITYQRRCKRKRDVNELPMQRIVDINRDGSLGSTSSVFAQEATQSKSGSQHPLIACMNLKSSCPGARSSCESECFKQAADNEMENIRSEDTSSVDVHTQIAELSPCSLDKDSRLEFQKDSLGNSSHDFTVDLALKPINIGLELQEGPMGNSSNKATVDPALEPVSSGLEFKEDSLEHSLNDNTVDPALKPINSGLDFQESPLGNSSNNTTVDPALVPVNSDLEFKEDSLGHLSNDNAVDPALEPINSGLEFQEGPLGNSSNNAIVNPVLEPVNSSLEFKEDSFGHSSNDMTVDPALKPINSGLEFQEGPLVNSSNNATVDPALEPVNSGLEFREDSLGHSSNDNSVDPAFEPINSGLEFQEGPVGNSSYNATVDPVLEPVNSGLEFKVDSFGHSSNDITVDPALKPVNSGLEFQGLLVNSSNNAIVDPALEPVNSGLEFKEDSLGHSSTDNTVDPAFEPINSGLEFQEGPLGNSSYNATVDPVLEPVNCGLEFKVDSFGHSSNDITVDPALKPVNSGLEFQVGPSKNSSNNASINPALEPINPGHEFQKDLLGKSSKDATIYPALEPVNSGFEFQEGPTGNSSNNATIDPAVDPVHSGIEFQEGPLGNSSNNTSVDPVLEPVHSGIEFQEGPLGNLSNNTSVDPVLEPVNSGIEFQEGRLENSSNNATLDPALEPVNPGPEFKKGPLGNSSNNATVDRVHELVNSGLEFQEGLLGNSAHNSTVGPALQSLLFNRHSSTGEESQLLSGDAPNTGGTCEIPCSRVVKESLDLSVPPPGECDITSVHDENPLVISLNAPLGEYDAQLNEECPGVKGLDLLHENTVEIRPSQQSEATVGCSHHELTNSFPAGMPRSTCLQLFPEDRMDDLSQATKMHQRDTAVSSSREKTVNPSETSGHDRTAEAKSSLLYGLFMPMKAINDGHSYNTAPSQWPVGGIQLRDFLQDGSKNFSGQPSTSQRRSMVLDGMVDRARTPKRNRPSSPSLYNYPTMLWSEEELDSLWVGVRRYGRGNWEVMLRDPRLAISARRTPWDLALQWEQEQSKLLNNIPSVEGRQFRQSTGFLGSMDGMCWQPKIGRQHSEGEPNLSLGDVYSGPRSSVSLQSNVPRHHQQATTSTRDRHSYTGSCRRPTPDADCSVSANSSTSVATGRSHPHWLKELVALAPMPTEGAVQLDTAAARYPWNRTEIAGPRAHLANEKDLIVIDSDASSEDTISDDRGGKM